MRRFVDGAGAAWDAVLGRESWGTLVVLFVPAGVARTEPVRQALLAATTYETAESELDGMTEEELLRVFSAATVKES